MMTWSDSQVLQAGSISVHEYFPFINITVITHCVIPISIQFRPVHNPGFRVQDLLNQKFSIKNLSFCLLQF